MATFLAALASIGTIVGALYGVFKYIAWVSAKTPEESKEEIDKTVDDEEKKVRQTGRPI